MTEDNWYSKYYKERYEKHFNLSEKGTKEPKKSDFKPYYTKPYYPSLSPPKPPESKQEQIPEKPKPEPYIVLKEVEKKISPEINKAWIILGALIIILIILGGIYFFSQKNPQTRFMPLDISASNLTGDSVIYYNGKSLFSISGWESKLEYSGNIDRLIGNEQYKKVVFDEKGKAYTAISLDNEVRLEPLTVSPEEVTRIGWFIKSEILAKEKRSFFDKQTEVLLYSNKDYIKNASLKYHAYKGKPYFKVEFSAGAENNSNLGDFSYGLIFQNYNIYLPTGEILENDNQLISLNRTVELTLNENRNITKNISKSLKESVEKEIDLNRKAITRKGSAYEDNSEYQIFVDKNKTRAIIVYSPYVILFEDSFYWNVFWVDVLKLEGGNYSPLYVIAIDKPGLTYDEEKQDWILNSRQYKGSVKSYISEVADKTEK